MRSLQQRVLGEQRRGIYRLGCTATALLGATRVGVPSHRRVRLLREDEHADLEMAAESVVVRDLGAAGGMRKLPAGTRFVVLE